MFWLLIYVLCSLLYVCDESVHPKHFSNSVCTLKSIFKVHPSPLFMCNQRSQHFIGRISIISVKPLHFVLLRKPSVLFNVSFIWTLSVGLLTPALVIPLTHNPPPTQLPLKQRGFKAETSRTEECNERGARGWQQLTEIRRICISFVSGLRKYNTHSAAQLDLYYLAFFSPLCAVMLNAGQQGLFFSGIKY